MTLKDWHDRLHGNYSGLAATRKAGGHELPIFALEHCLTKEETGEVEQEIRASVVAGRLSDAYYLPWIAYATEIGYRYDGAEYWQTFQGQTPRWIDLGGKSRDWLRRQFGRFHKQYRGLKPKGAWATQFTIICWPIQHAILPAYLQRHLARLLYDNRYELTSDLLRDPEAHIVGASGMGFYDADTVQAATQAGISPLHTFLTANDDPSVNGYADANFLRARLGAYVASVQAAVLAQVPSTVFEILWPLDVNDPTRCQLLRYVNMPPAWQVRAGSGFDTFLCEGFQYGGIDFNLDEAQTCAGYPFTALFWDRAHCRYLAGWYYAAWPWAREFQAAQRTAVPLGLRPSLPFRMAVALAEATTRTGDFLIHNQTRCL